MVILKKFSFWSSLLILIVILINFLGYDDKNIILCLFTPFPLTTYVYFADLVFWFSVGFVIDHFITRQNPLPKLKFQQTGIFLGALLILVIITVPPGERLVKKALTHFNSDEFQATRLFYEDLAAVRIGYYWGFINKSGEVVIDPMFDDAGIFYEGIAHVVLNGENKYIDKTGKIYDNPPKGYANPTRIYFSKELKPFPDGNLWGFMNQEGTVIIKPQFKHIWEFSSGMAQVITADGKSGYVDTKGNIISKPKSDV